MSKNKEKGEESMKCGSGCACGSDSKSLTDEQKQILAAMAECGGPCGTKEIAAATGCEAKTLSTKITDLKKQGLVDSPVRCKYGITAAGRDALKS
jgi:predicted transcriptional regulator